MIVKALEKFKIAKLNTKKHQNGVTSDVLSLTRTTADRQTVRLYKILYQKMRAINVVFDPLGEFHNEEPMVGDDQGDEG